MPSQYSRDDWLAASKMSPHPQFTTHAPEVYVGYWYQVDSRTAIARRRLSGSPHLQAAHWKISSVLPVNAPLTRGRSQLSQRAAKEPSAERGRAANAARTLDLCGLTWFGTLFSGLGSHEDRWTAAAHARSPRSDLHAPTPR